MGYAPVYKTIGQILTRQAVRHPNREAVTDSTHRYTYAQWEALTDQAAGALLPRRGGLHQVRRHRQSRPHRHYGETVCACVVSRAAMTGVLAVLGIFVSLAISVCDKRTLAAK